MKLTPLLPVLGLALVAAPVAAFAAPKVDGSYPPCTKTRTDDCQQVQKPMVKHHATAAKHGKTKQITKREEPKQVARR